MNLEEYTGEGKTIFKLKHNGKTIASHGFRANNDFISFEHIENIDFKLVSKLEKDKFSQFKIYFGVLEPIKFLDVKFAICPIKVNLSKISIGISYRLSDNYFDSNQDIKQLTESLKIFHTEHIRLEKIYSEENLENYEIVWEAIFDFEQNIQHYLNIIKQEFSKIIAESIAKNSLNWKDTYKTNELLFTKELLIPIFRLMGFKSVRFNHGTQEFGKDITFFDFDKFKGIEYYAVQVKAGDLSGKSNSKINDILSQIDDIIKIPFKDMDSGREQYISKIIIAISGDYKENAKVKLLHHIPDYFKGNVKFVDKSKILSMIEEITKNNIQQRFL